MQSSDHNDVSRGTAAGITEHGRLVELHRQTVVFRQSMHFAANCDIQAALLHPDLLVKSEFGTVFIRHVGAWRQYHFDDPEAACVRRR